MRVLHIDSSSEWGGGQNQIRLLMRECRAAGIEQLCICPRGSPLAERLRRAAFSVKAVPWAVSVDPRAALAISWAIRHCDLVHCHDAHALQLALPPAKLLRKPIVAARRVPFRTRRGTWSRADRVVAISETVRDVLRESGIERGVRVVHSGADIEEARAVTRLEPSLRSRQRVPENAFVVGTAAALYPVKNLRIIPEAAALLPDTHWMIAGEGPERGAIEAAIAREGVAGRVHLLGWLADARSLMKEADVAVYTSLNDALGNAVLEALAMGVPVVAADAAGPAEIMRPVQAATGSVLFEPRSAAALAARVDALRDPALRARVVAAQDERIQAFDIRDTAAATIQVYRELVPG